MNLHPLTEEQIEAVRRTWVIARANNIERVIGEQLYAYDPALAATQLGFSRELRSLVNLMQGSTRPKNSTEPLVLRWKLPVATRGRIWLLRRGNRSLLAFLR